MLIALQAVGIDLTLLSVFGGALGVGIGLGLQKLASNYIAGFTILIDRSIRLGDMITVDARHGVVTRVTSRYVVVRSLDGVEAIVPNETLVTTTVLNHSYTSRDVRLGLPSRSPTRAISTSRCSCSSRPPLAHPRVMKSPNRADGIRRALRATAGSSSSSASGSSTRRTVSSTFAATSTARSSRAFAEHGIKIPYPQRELRILGRERPRRHPAGAVGRGARRTPEAGSTARPAERLAQLLYNEL